MLKFNQDETIAALHPELSPDYYATATATAEDATIATIANDSKLVFSFKQKYIAATNQVDKKIVLKQFEEAYKLAKGVKVRFTQQEIMSLLGVNVQTDLIDENDWTNSAFANRVKTANVVNYLGEQNKWLVWDEQKNRWVKTQVAQKAEQAIYAEVRKEMAIVDTIKDPATRQQVKACAKALESYSFLNGTLQYLKTLSNIENSQLDPITHLMCSDDGYVVDLRDGSVFENKKELYLTKNMNCDLEGGLDLFNTDETDFGKFVLNIMSGDVEKYNFFKRAIGYAFTGSCREKVAFMCYAKSGDNGKSAVLDLIHEIGGSYAKKGDSNMLTSKRHGAEETAHQGDVKPLVGGTFTYLNEPSGMWRLEKFKSLVNLGTQKKLIRDVGEKAEEVVLTNTYFIDTNSPPYVERNDPATWKRLIIIPFNEVYKTKDEIAAGAEYTQVADRLLPSKLLQDRKAIVAWIVAGAIDYHNNGLGTIPKACVDAKAKLMAERDFLSKWLHTYLEKCSVADSIGVASAFKLFDYCQTNYEFTEKTRILKDKSQFANAIDGRGAWAVADVRNKAVIKGYKLNETGLKLAEMLKLTDFVGGAEKARYEQLQAELFPS